MKTSSKWTDVDNRRYVGRNRIFPRKIDQIKKLIRHLNYRIDKAKDNGNITELEQLELRREEAQKFLNRFFIFWES